MVNVNDWRIGGCAGFILTGEDGSHAIRAYCGNGDCDRCAADADLVCPFVNADSAEGVCGWEAAYDLASYYSEEAMPSEPVRMSEELEELFRAGC